MKTSTGAVLPQDEATLAGVTEPTTTLKPPIQKLEALRPRLGSLMSRRDRLLSGRAVSAMIGEASRRNIRRWVDRGEFNSYALDGKTVYSEREVLDFLERVKAKGPSRAPWRGRRRAAGRERPNNAPKQ
jgi:hypothetical protein